MAKRNSANQDIRELMRTFNVTQEELGKRMGFSRSKVSEMLATELSDRLKAHVVQHIESLATERTSAPGVTKSETPCDSKFQIGDRVRIRAKPMLVGIVRDIWISAAQGKTMYAVENEQTGTRGLYADEQLEPAPLPIDYTINVSVEDNVVVISMIAHQGDKTWVHDRSHAHILRSGPAGLSQAVSYAGKRLFEHLNPKDKDRHSKEKAASDGANIESGKSK